MGCLAGFAQMIARTCFALGAFAGSVLIRGIGFVVLTIVAPLSLGSAREILARLMRLTIDGKPIQSRWNIGSRTGYAVVSGAAWVVVFAVGRVVWRALVSIGDRALDAVAPALSAWLPPLLVALAVFALGGAIGATVHRHDYGGPDLW